MAPSLLTKAELSVDHYAVLQIAPSATSKEIRQSYRKLAKAYHPDKTQTQSRPLSHSGSSDRFQRVNQAKEILLDESKRRFYDRNRIHAYSNAAASYSHQRTCSTAARSSASKNKRPKASTVIRPKSGLTFHQAKQSHQPQQKQPAYKSVQGNATSSNSSSAPFAARDAQQKDRLKNLFLKQQRAQKDRRRASSSSASVASAPASLRTPPNNCTVPRSTRVQHNLKRTAQVERAGLDYTTSPSNTAASTSSDEEKLHSSPSFHIPSNSAPFKGQGAACILQAFKPIPTKNKSKQQQERGRLRHRHRSEPDSEDSDDDHSTFSSNHESTDGSDHEHDFVQDYFPSSESVQPLQRQSSVAEEDVIFPRKTRQQRLLFGKKKKPKSTPRHLRAASLPPQRSKPKARAEVFVPPKANTPVAFGFTRKQLPCRICIQLGQYCQYHAHQQHDAFYQELRKLHSKQPASSTAPPLELSRTKSSNHQRVLGILPNGLPCTVCLQRQNYCTAHAAQKYRPQAYSAAKQ